MIHSHLKRSSLRGITLFELLSAIAVVGILTAVAISNSSQIVDGAESTKLNSEIATINQAVRTYIANGGDLDGISTPQAALDRLKSHLSDADSSKFAGFSGTMLDKRLAAKSFSGQAGEPRAVWNSSDQRFELASSGTGVKFVLNDLLASADYGTDQRDALLDYEPGDGWVWAYTEGATLARPGPTTIPIPGATGSGSSSGSGSTSGSGTTGSGSTSGGSGSGSGTPITPSNLSTPLVSIPGGTFLPSEFDLTVSLSNPNPTASSWIMIAINSGSFSNYSGPVTVASGDSIRAYVDGDPILWNPSLTVGHSYTATAVVPLAPPAINPSIANFAWTTAETASVTISNPNDSAVSSVEYRVDGEAWTSYGGSFDLSINDHASGVAIDARATPATADYSVSPTASASVGGASSMPLDPPTISPSATEFVSGSVDTIAVTIGDPNSSGSSLQYRIDGGGWTAYSAPFNLTSAAYPTGATIEAQAIATSATYTDSSVASTSIGVSASTEKTTGIDPGSWNRSGATATYTFNDGTSVVLTAVGTSWGGGSFNNWNAWSKALGQTSSVAATYSAGDRFTVEVFDAANQRVSPQLIELHFDRVGGSFGSGEFTLQGGRTWASTAGNTGFQVTSSIVQTSLSGTNQSGGSAKANQTGQSLTVINNGSMDRIGIQVTVAP